MRNADRIRSMTDEQMGNFLWTWEINALSSFLEHGGTRLMNAAELERWLDSEEFVREETRVGEDFDYGQDFRMKERGHGGEDRK